LRLIKKYPNRKFYDTEDKRYISLSGIAALIARGEDVQVVDNQTGRRSCASSNGEGRWCLPPF
jgi:polyhydroxyalkanoate synthesis regulator protein